MRRATKMTAAQHKRTFARRVIKSTQLRRSLDMLREHYESNRHPEHLVIPYVLTCAAYLEAKLNDSLYETSKQYNEDFAQGMMSLSLPNKLKMLVPTLTNGKYSINKEHFVYQRLISLIRIRNTIAHAKSELEEVTVSPDELTEIFVMNEGLTSIPKQFMSEPDMTLGASKDFSPLEYHEALDKLEKWFFLRCPDRLTKVAMVVARPQESPWKEEFST
jgi:hypothetical protein